MLKAHINAVESQLLVTSQIPANTGHSLHKGTPREAFIKQFLDSHLSERVATGTGEIIDTNSKPGESRHQMDIVIYKRDYPKLDFGGNISGFLVESVVATIEVKSTLTEEEMGNAVRAAKAAKALTRKIVTSHHAGYQPPSVLNYVVAYAGPVNMSTVHGWLDPIHKSQGISSHSRSLDPNVQSTEVSPSVDGIFVLGRGFVLYDNSPIGFISDDDRAREPEGRWQVCSAERGSLLMLFQLLTMAVSGFSSSWIEPGAYLSDFRITSAVLRP